MNLSVTVGQLPPTISNAFLTLPELRTHWWHDCPPALFSQERTNAFLDATDDRNPIHREGGVHPPIAPGLLTLSSLPRYLEGKLPLRFAGFATMLYEVTARFPRPVFVGERVVLRYYLHKPRMHEHLPAVSFQFRLTVLDEKTPSVDGSAEVRFIEQERFDMLVKMAARRLRVVK